MGKEVIGAGSMEPCGAAQATTCMSVLGRGWKKRDGALICVTNGRAFYDDLPAHAIRPVLPKLLTLLWIHVGNRVENRLSAYPAPLCKARFCGKHTM